MVFDPSAASQPDSGIFGLPHPEKEAQVVVLPVPFEATTSYGGGTSRGPEAVLSASRQVDLFDAETGRPYEAGIHMLPIPASIAELGEGVAQDARTVIAAGGAAPGTPAANAAARVDAACERMNAWVDGEAERLLHAGKRVATLGGDHSISFGAIAAHARAHPGMGVLHVDAHADLRKAFEGFTWSHASIMYNVVERLPGVAKLVQVGIRDLSEEESALAQGSKGRVTIHHLPLLARAAYEGETWAAQVARILEPLPAKVYLSFDIDGLDPTLCPHTGTPVPGGLDFQQACYLIGALARSGRQIVGVDLTEVAPGPNGDEWDGNVGARLLYKMIGWMLRSGK
jgi:agmatinase